MINSSKVKQSNITSNIEDKHNRVCLMVNSVKTKNKCQRQNAKRKVLTKK